MWNFDWLLPVDTETSGPDEWLNADAVFQFDSTEDDSARLLNSYPSSASLEHSITTPSSSSLSSVSPSTTLTSPPTTTNNTSNDELEHLLSDTSFQAFQTALAAAAAAKNSKKASTFGYLDALQSPTPIKGSTAGSVSGEPDDKRKRNTAASARFRAKKKMREMALEQAAKESMAKSEMLERRLCGEFIL
ncbi:hypothetical protein BC829DRAFT_395975 [Chytridium lagenaria]|nr:hypothetical protein BC829DRAFT_395975 [Chytridium lagenaria]